LAEFIYNGVFFFEQQRVVVNEDVQKAKKDLAKELDRIGEWTKKDAVARSKS
jgi:hypothetical protein